ncbi:MAG: sulfatase [Myxococcota bacterium]|nr:sulfatase [Myxococcota bacterium]
MRARARRWIACAAPLLCALGCRAEAPAGAPNLLLVTVDTLRADTLACYGGEATVGAALCALGDRGVRYVWAFSTAPSTAPSIASLLTSRYPQDHGVTEFATTTLADEVETVAERLADAGWHTAAFVSNPVLHPARSLGQGFATYDARMNERETNRAIREREARATTDAALAWAREAREPWFLWVHYQDPHGPYDPPNAAPPREAPGGVALRPLREHSGYGGIPAYQTLPGLRRSTSYEGRYRDEIRYLDAHVGRLLADLDAQGSPPGVLLTADHGEAFGEDGYYFAHGHSVGLEQVRVPLLWRPPGGRAPAVVAAPVSTVDVAPTLLAAAGVPAPEAWIGRPLPLVEPEDGGSSRALFVEHRARAAVLQGGRYYARDRTDLGRGVPDRVTGGLLRPLPTRSATLDPGGGLPAYEADARVAELERSLAEHLRGAPALTLEGKETLDDERREALRALGYLE